MKKMVNLLLVSILAISLAACGSNSTKDAGETNSGSPGNDSGVPTASELMDKSAEASKELKSFTLTSSVIQNVDIEANGQKQTQDINMDMTQNIVMNPMSIYQEIKVTMPNIQDTTIKQYITPDGVYTNTGDAAWMKLSDSEAAPILEELKNSTKIDQQLTSLEPYTNELKVSEEGDTYVLTADLSGDSMKELAGTLMNQAGGGSADTQALLEQMNIDSMKVTSVINKSTYLPTQATVDMTMSFEQEGQQVSMKMKMNSTFSKHNEIDKIEIPEEVLSSAQ